MQYVHTYMIYIYVPGLYLCSAGPETFCGAIPIILFMFFFHLKSLTPLYIFCFLYLHLEDLFSILMRLTTEKNQGGHFIFEAGMNRFKR